ncbi:MAG: hypothetical protein ACOYL6_18605 [Bacteriovoracaceae bacterium]
MKFIMSLLFVLSSNAFAFESSPYLECEIQKGFANAGQSFKLYAASEYERALVFSAKMTVPYASDAEFITKGTSNITGVWAKNFKIEGKSNIYASIHLKNEPSHTKDKFKATFIVAGLPNPISSDDIFVAETKCRRILDQQ